MFFDSPSFDDHPDGRDGADDRDDRAGGDSGGGVIRNAVLWLALGALLASTWQALRRSHRQRHGSRSQPLPERLQTWEGEGGRPDPEAQAGDSVATPTTH